MTLIEMENKIKALRGIEQRLDCVKALIRNAKGPVGVLIKCGSVTLMLESAEADHVLSHLRDELLSCSAMLSNELNLETP